MPTIHFEATIFTLRAIRNNPVEVIKALAG